MQITFAEESQGQLHNERSFDGPIVPVGRNPATCQIIFDQKQWPTVSRQHAQFQLKNDRWFVSDSGSTYGTLVDGQIIKEPTEVRLHSRVQFGTGGPVLVITKIESGITLETLVDPPLHAPQSAPTPVLNPNAPAQPPQASQSHPVEPVFVELSGAGTGRLRQEVQGRAPDRRP